MKVEAIAEYLRPIMKEMVNIQSTIKECPIFLTNPKLGTDYVYISIQVKVNLIYHIEAAENFEIFLLKNGFELHSHENTQLTYIKSVSIILDEIRANGLKELLK